MEKSIIEFFGEVSPDAWVQSFGTLFGAGLGAFLGGMYASRIFNKEQKFQRLERVREVSRELEETNNIVVIEMVRCINKINEFNNVLIKVINGNVSSFIKLNEIREELLLQADRILNIRDERLSISFYSCYIEYTENIQLILKKLSSSSLDVEETDKNELDSLFEFIAAKEENLISIVEALQSKIDEEIANLKDRINAEAS
jgi:hypothetical protein